ncbi:MAG: CHAT domain-containing protein, partial [Acidobacteria bacterium]|nr:CHAT domain-containing protein [Acidobacteriota bacterium]
RPPQPDDAAVIHYDQLANRVKILLGVERFQEVLPIAEQLVTAAAEAYGAESAQYASAILQVGEINYRVRNLPKAESSYVQALALREKLFGPDHEEVSIVLNNLALLYKAKREFDKAVGTAQRSIAIIEKVVGLNHPQVAMGYNTLGEIYRVQNKFAQAETTFQTALSRGDYIKAVELLKEVVVKRKATVGEKHPLYATGLLNLAEGYRKIGRFAEMEPLMKQALAIQQEANGPESFPVATCLNNLGDYYRETGNYGLAETYLQQALSIVEKIDGKQSLELCPTLINLGVQAEARFDFQTAESYYRRALTIQEHQSVKDELQIANTYLNLSRVFFAQGNLDRDIELKKRVLTIFEKVLPSSHPSINWGYRNLGRAYLAAKDYPQATIFLEKAQAHLLGQAVPSIEDLVFIYFNLGNLYWKLNDLNQAEFYFNKALTEVENVPDTSSANNSGVFITLFSFYSQTGDFQRAKTYLGKFQDLIEKRLVTNLITGSENQKQLLIKGQWGWFDHAISFHLAHFAEQSNLSQLALQAILRKKGRALDAMTNNINTLRSQSSPEGQAAMDELFVLRSRLSALSLRGPGKTPIEQYRAKLADLEKQTSRLETKLSTLSFQYRQLATPVNLPDIQAAIPEQSTLVEYCVYVPYSTQTWGSPRYAVYTLDRSGKIGFADLGERSEIDNLIKEFRQALAAAGDQRNLTKINLSTERRRSLNQVQKLARQLDAKLLQPVRKFIGNKDHLLISPDGALNLIPFAALVDESHRYLVESHEITYLSSGRDLLRLKDKIPTSQPALVLANPKFDDGPGPTIFGQHFDPLVQLPGGEQEGKLLKSLFPKTQLKQGGDATETILKQTQQPEILHIATHGYFLEPDQTTQALTQTLENRSLSLGLSDQTVSPEFIRQSSPLLRSMLFFSGANRPQTPTEAGDDGILTALEVASLNLWGTKLVVLSACDTGVGEVKRGDGVFGLRRALVLAGSESQMISLWPVSDAGTRELMFKYYRRLKAGEGRSKALRNAQLDLIKNPKRKHPYFWASFIQSGEWANLNGKR